MASTRGTPQAWGRIGGLRAWARHDNETLVGPAHRAFKARFERIVDPENRLDPAERIRRADRARRAHMLQLAQRSAQVRRSKARRPATPPIPASRRIERDDTGSNEDAVASRSSLDGRRTEGKPAYGNSARAGDDRTAR
jgi:hypothetical protein